MTEEIPKDERKQLESKVKEAINKGCSVNFVSKDFNIHQIKYMQKYAEIVLFHLDVFIATIILLVAVGVSYFLTFYSSTDFFYYTYKWVGFIAFIIGGYFFYYIWWPRYNNAKKVILDLEWQIQIPNEDKEKE